MLLILGHCVCLCLSVCLYFLTNISDIKESQNIASLHRQIAACDQILEVSTSLHCSVLVSTCYLIVSAVSLHTGCLQLLEILEISWNLKTILEILEISWNLIGPPGNFCVRCWRSIASVSSRKNMDKYSLQKIRNLSPSDVFFSSSRCTKTTHVGNLMTLPQIPIRLGRAEIPLRRRPKQGKHVLDFSLEISWKFAWLNL